MTTEITKVDHQDRAAEMSADSKQPRFSDKEVSEFYISIMNWINNEIENEPEYSPKSRTRDKWLAEVWMMESHLAGVVNSVVSIDKNRGWTLVGGRNQVNKYTKILHNFVAAPNLYGWRNGTSVSALSYYVTDMNSVIEIGRDGKNGPLRQLFSVDSTLCELTDDMEYPLKYFPHGKSVQKWEILDFMRCASLPDMREEYNGLGHCALSRCIELTKLMVAVYEHDREQLGSKAPRGLLLLEGIAQKQWDSAMLIRAAKKEGLEQEYFANVAVLASGGAQTIDAKMVALSNLPKNFDLQAFTSMLMYGYALCFGYDPSEFYPVQFGSLGRGTEMEIQHEKATVKGKLDYAYAFQENLQGEIPPTVEFLFDERDDSGDLTLANVQKTHAEQVAAMRNTGPGDLTSAEARQLWAEMGLIPREWTEVDEDVEIEDTEAPEVEEEEAGDVETDDTESTEAEERRFERLRKKRDRDRLLSSIHIRSAAETFPKEAIVEYSWPQKRVHVLAESGHELLAPPRSYHFISRAVLYDDEGVEITDEDVEKAIEEGDDRMGAEFKSLLLGEPPPEERSFWARILKREDEHWYWDKASFRYVNSAGAVFPQAQMKTMLTESIKLSSEHLNNISNQYANGSITRTQFIDGMRLELKNEYIRNYMLGRGGYGQMTYADWGSVGGDLAAQYRYIDGFADDLLAGKLSPGQIEVRSGMYSNSARESYSKGKEKVMRSWGADEEAWQTAAFSDSCVDCVDFQDEGWQSIGHFPVECDGSTVCLTNCHCGKTYRNSKTGEEYEE
jgi:hypothetical protein